MRCVATGGVGGVLAGRAIFNGSIRAELIPIGVAAEWVYCTDGVTARLVGAVRGLARLVATARIRITAAGAVCNRCTYAVGIPARFAAEGVGCAHEFAARRVLAEGGRLRGVAGTGFRIATVRALLNRFVHTGQIPLGVAAERIHSAHGCAALCIIARGRWVGGKARFCCGLAAVGAQIDGAVHADLIPRVDAAEGVFGADGLAARRVHAALATVGREAVSGTAATSASIGGAAEVGEGEPSFADGAGVVARVGNTSRSARPVDERRREARNARAGRVGHHGAILQGIGSEEAMTNCVIEDAAVGAAAAVARGMAAAHVVAEFMREGAIREAAERCHAESEVRIRSAV